MRGDTNLLTVPLEGDWVVKSKAPRAAVLKEFSAIVERETGRKIRIEPRTESTEVLVARGVVHPAVMDGARPAEQPHMDVDIDPLNYASGHGDAPAGEWLGWISNWLEIPIVSALDAGNQTKRVAWTLTSHRRVEDPNLSHETWVEQEIAIIKSQSGISLTRETRPAELWYLSEVGQ